jgi:hypothetical protein
MEERNLRSWSKSRSENFENSATLNRELKKRVFLCLSFPNALIPIVVHTGPKANTNKTQHKQIYVVPQNRVRPRRQQIVYYWRNDTNTQLNQVQSHKTQCFTLTLGVSLKSALFSLSQLHYFLLLHTCTHTFTCTNCLHL